MVKNGRRKDFEGMINDGGELALPSIAPEEGQFGVAHMLYAIPLPYSVLEMRLRPIGPAPLYANRIGRRGDGVGERAAKRMDVLGYSNVAVLEGGMDAWADAGYEVFMGVNVLCKAFGEVVEHASPCRRSRRKNFTRCRVAAKKSWFSTAGHLPNSIE